MKRHLLLGLNLFFAFILNAQQWDWAKNFSFEKQNSGGCIGTDKTGNVYVTNAWSAAFLKCDNSGNIVWKVDTLAVPGIFAIDSSGNSYFVGGNRIAKYNSAGSKLWIVSANIPNAYFESIALHPSGDVVVAGRTISDTSKSIFSRYDQNGNLLWTKIGEFFPGTAILKCDNLGNIYIEEDGPLDSASGNWGSLVKYNNSGTLLYNKAAIGTTVTGMAIDNNNNIYIGGCFGFLNILGHIYTATSSTQNPLQFLIKYDPTGNVLWYKIINGMLGSGAITTDKHGNIYLTNSYSALTVDSMSLIEKNGTNLFIMKADSAGTILWYKNSVANVSGAYASTGGICVSTNDDVCITGSMRKTNTFGSYTLEQTTSYSDLLIVKISPPLVTSASTIMPTENENLYILPNPAKGIFGINYFSSENRKVQLNILDAQGKSIYTEVVSQVNGEFKKNIDLGKQAKGIYFIEVISGNERRTKKIVLE